MSEPEVAAPFDSSTGSSRSIRVGGAIVGEDGFVAALERSDPEAVRRLVRQIQDDRAVDAQYSLGLELVSRSYRAFVMAYLFARRCRGDAQMVDEAWNDTLLRVYTTVEQYDPRRSAFRTWVVNQARYAAMDLQRTRARHSGHDVPGGNLWNELAAGDGSRLPIAVDPDGAMPEPLTTREEQALRLAMKRLNDTQRRLLWYRFVMELTHVEIARHRLVDVQEDHVRVYVNRAARRLAELFYEEMASRTADDGRKS